MKIPDEKFMRLAIDKAKQGIRELQTPFGVCITNEREVISCTHNIVWESMDITAHAEIHAIREAIVYGTRIEDAKKLGFSELTISNKEMKKFGNSQIEIVGDFLRDENLKLFELWYNQENKRVY